MRDYLTCHRVMVLATHGPDGPWASPVYYACDAALCLYFFSDPASRHGQNLATCGWASAAITEDYADWRIIQGIQLEGPVDTLAGEAYTRGLEVYLKKFPWAKPFFDPQSDLYALAGAKVRLYRLRPYRIGFTDNRMGFGHREWLEFA